MLRSRGGKGGGKEGKGGERRGLDGIQAIGWVIGMGGYRELDLSVCLPSRRDAYLGICLDWLV